MLGYELDTIRHVTSRHETTQHDMWNLSLIESNLSSRLQLGSVSSSFVRFNVSVDALFSQRCDASRRPLAQLVSVVPEPLPQLVVKLPPGFEAPVGVDVLLVEAFPLAVHALACPSPAGVERSPTRLFGVRRSTLPADFARQYLALSANMQYTRVVRWSSCFAVGIAM